MKIIGFVGLKQSGKTTVAHYVGELLPNKTSHLNFADAVKAEVAVACNIDLEFIEKHKKEFRPMLQWWGTDFRRNFHGQDYWIMRWLQTMHRWAFKPTVLLCSDVRFHNEANVIRELSGTLIRVERSVSSSVDMHASEVEQLSIPCDYTIFNNGSLAELKQKTKQTLQLCLNKQPLF